jgi:hypothetical protein
MKIPELPLRAKSLPLWNDSTYKIRDWAKEKTTDAVTKPTQCSYGKVKEAAPNRQIQPPQRPRVRKKVERASCAREKICFRNQSYKKWENGKQTIDLVLLPRSIAK